MSTVATLDQEKITPIFNHIHLVVLDSVGVGTTPGTNNLVNADMPDGISDTLGHISKTVGLTIPSMAEIGLGDILRETSLRTIPAETQPNGYTIKLEEVSCRKNTMTGHWETIGFSITEPLDTFFEGLLEEILIKIEEFPGHKVIHEANKPYLGTQIIVDFGKHQMKTGELIVYTSADSVLQIVAHEDITPLDGLYKIYELTRSITLERPSLFGRIVARSYVGKPGNFTRTAGHRDCALSPFAPAVLNKLADVGVPTYGVGKINDIFNGSGTTNDMGHNKSNMHSVDILIKTLQLPEFTKGLSFTSLVGSDAMYGHRRSTAGYYDCLEEFDNHLPEIMGNVKSDNLLLITADHNNDPTYTGADHVREHTPLSVYSPSFKGNGISPVGRFADIPATTAGSSGIEVVMIGQSFLEKLV